MASQEERISSLEEKYNNLHTVVSVIASKVDATNEKVDNLISEMRDRDNRRADEIAEIRTSIDSMGKHVRNISIAAFAGIGAMVITSVIGISAMVWSVISK